MLFPRSASHIGLSDDCTMHGTHGPLVSELNLHRTHSLAPSYELGCCLASLESSLLFCELYFCPWGGVSQAEPGIRMFGSVLMCSVVGSNNNPRKESEPGHRGWWGAGP